MRFILTRFRDTKFYIDIQKCLLDIIKIEYFNLIVVIKDI